MDHPLAEIIVRIALPPSFNQAGKAVFLLPSGCGERDCLVDETKRNEDQGIPPW